MKTKGTTIKTKKRHLDEHKKGPAVILEIDPKFDRTLSVVNSVTNQVIGFLTVDMARQAGEWAAKKVRPGTEWAEDENE